MNLGKATELLEEAEICLKLFKNKQTLDDARAETEGFEEEFAEEYAKLLAELEREMAAAETEEELDEMRGRFMSAATALMSERLRRRMARAVRLAWQGAVDDVELSELLTARDMLAVEAVDASFTPRLRDASAVEKESLVQKLAAIGSYGMLYAGMIWAGFWTSRVISGPPDATYRWGGTIDEATCVDCMERIGEEYTKDALPGMPGDQSTVCDGRCRCFLFEIR